MEMRGTTPQHVIRPANTYLHGPALITVAFQYLVHPTSKVRTTLMPSRRNSTAPHVLGHAGVAQATRGGLPTGCPESGWVPEHTSARVTSRRNPPLTSPPASSGRATRDNSPYPHRIMALSCGNGPPHHRVKATAQDLHHPITFSRAASTGRLRVQTVRGGRAYAPRP